MANLANLGWFKTYRLAYFEHLLSQNPIAEVKPRQLELEFNVSRTTIYFDLLRYLELAPGNIELSQSRKAYVRTESFKPLFKGFTLCKISPNEQ